MDLIKILIAIIILFNSITVNSQAEKLEKLKSNKPLYEAFQKFYVENIREETKDEWGEPYYYTVEHINGVNYFDYNNDGLKDCLIEFSSRASDGGTFYFLVTVLFEKHNNEYRYVSYFHPQNNEDHHISYIHPNNISFENFSYPYFIFSEYSNYNNNEKIGDKIYLLLNNKFVEQ